jgi:hypothetical protein
MLLVEKNHDPVMLQASDRDAAISEMFGKAAGVRKAESIQPHQITAIDSLLKTLSSYIRDAYAKLINVSFGNLMTRNFRSFTFIL